MTNPRDEKAVVVIDDDDIMRLSCEEILRKAGYRVETFGNGHAGIERLRQLVPAVLVVDIKMPELDGFEVIEIVRKIDPDLVIVVITGYATIETAIDAMKAGAHDFLPKPFTPGELRLIIERAFDRWRLVAEAKRLRREKEEVERKFVTLVSHQLKSPLVAVKQYLDVLLITQGGQLPEQAMEWIGRSQERLGEMLDIIGDWLALAKLERGALADRNVRTDLAGIVNQVVDAHRQQPGVSVEFVTEAEAELPAVCGDCVTLSMLVTNLVSNAVKYNKPRGRVTVRLARAGDEARMDVSDTGIGIPAESLPRLFDEFYRVKCDAAQNIPGTGLGLTICEKVVRELGGSIHVDSAEGVGTTFTVRIPFARNPVPASPASLPEAANRQP